MDAGTWDPGFMIEQHALISPEPSLLSPKTVLYPAILPCLTDMFKETKRKLSLYIDRVSPGMLEF